MKKTSELESNISKEKKYLNMYFHYDESILKEKIQPALLRILIDFDKICKENNITYFIIAGTLLGAVREKGFIPWDDDIDIVMFPKEIKKLKNAIIKSNMEDKYMFLLPEETKEITVDGKFMSKTESLGKLMENLQIGHNLYMDVLPIENVPNNRILRTVKSIFSKMLMLSYNSMRCLTKYDKLLNIMAEDNRELYMNLVVRKCVAIPARIMGKNKMLKLLNKVNSYDDDSTVYVSIPLGVKMYNGELLPRSVFQYSVQLSFEGVKLSAPVQYEIYLSHRYGGDYMTPVPLEKRELKCFARKDDWEQIYKSYCKNLEE